MSNTVQSFQDLLSDNNSSLSDPHDSRLDVASQRKHHCKDSTIPEDGHKQRHKTTENTWSFTCNPKPNEPIRNKHSYQIWYCARCSYKTPNLKRIHEHLASKHNIHAREELKPKE